MDVIKSNNSPRNSIKEREKCLYVIQKYSETSIHRFHQGSEKETMDQGKQ
jgi:hypothetical protein